MNRDMHINFMDYRGKYSDGAGMAYHECRPVITGENDGENLSMID